MAEISIEAYLRSLRPTNKSYTIPDEKFTILLHNYTEMKKKIAECGEIKKEYDVLIANKTHVTSQFFKIKELEQELERVRQENARLEKNTRDALIIAENAVTELKSVRAKNKP